MSSRNLGIPLVLGATLFWATSGLWIRWAMGSGTFTALSLAFWREVATSGLLLAVLVTVRPAWLRVSWRDLPWLAALGALGVGAFHVLWNLTITQIGYGVATVLLYSSPAFVAVMAWLVWREPLTWIKAVALGVTIAGCVLVTGIEELTAQALTASGLGLGLATAIGWGSFSVLGRRVAPRYSPWTVLMYGFGFGAVALLPFQFGARLPWPLAGDTGVWFLTLVTVATILPFGMYVAALGRLPASVASLLAALEVVFASAIGYVVFGEKMGGWQIVGAGLVIAGLALVVRKGE